MDDKLNLQAAYEADLALREEKTRSAESELQASKEYINVLNGELAAANEQIESIKRTLYSNEREIEEVKLKNKRKIVWLVFSILEAVLLIVLAVAFFEKDSLETALINPSSENVTPGLQPDENEAETTYKQVEDLAARVENIDKEKIAPFEASVIEKYGLEYLCFTYGGLKLLYRNEFTEGEISAVQRVQMDNGSKLAEFNRKYDLTGELELLCPNVGSYFNNGKEQLLFMTYSDNETHNFPEKMEFYDVERLWDYEPLFVQEAIYENIGIEYKDKLERDAEEPIAGSFMTIMVNETAYNYEITQDEYTNAIYNGENLLHIDGNSSMSFEEGGIVVTSVFALSEQRYIGEFSANIVLDNGEVKLSSVKYGAYVHANQEDIDLNGIIQPYSEYIADRVTIGGRNGERFIIAKSTLVQPCTYNWELLDTSDANNWMYKDEAGNTLSIRGIDVSRYQGDINWSRVADAGIEFAIIRLGYRGFNEGTLEIDPYYRSNIRGAVGAGVKAGVYFFSQAVNEEEAREEAAYVLRNIADYNIEYPIIFDTERVTTYDARANDLTRQERTDICIAFCDEIKAAGYTPMVYANTKYMIMGIDLEQLSEYDKWFAYYGNSITFPYDFQILQYSESGSIPGIDSPVDLNISFIDYSSQGEQD